jgi:hypothetical protein
MTAAVRQLRQELGMVRRGRAPLLGDARDSARRRLVRGTPDGGRRGGALRGEPRVGGDEPTSAAFNVPSLVGTCSAARAGVVCGRRRRYAQCLRHGDGQSPASRIERLAAAPWLPASTAPTLRAWRCGRSRAPLHLHGARQLSSTLAAIVTGNIPDAVACAGQRVLVQTSGRSAHRVSGAVQYDDQERILRDHLVTAAAMRA